MKIRNGFVSNSSSSSFMIAVKGGGKLPTKADYQKLLGVVPGTIAEKLVEPYIRLFMSAHKFDLKEFLDDNGYKTLEGYKVDNARWIAKEIKLLEDGWDVYTFSVSNEDFDNPASVALYEQGLPGDKIQTDTLYIGH